MNFRKLSVENIRKFPLMLNFRKTHNPTTLQCADRPRAGLWAAPLRRPGQPISLEVPPSATRSRGPSEAVLLAVRRSAVLRRQRQACLEHVAVVAERALAAGGRISAAVAASTRSATTATCSRHAWRCRRRTAGRRTASGTAAEGPRDRVAEGGTSSDAGCPGRR